MDNSRYCLWCFETVKLSQCGRCRNAYYCCKDHQVRHWKAGHKLVCKPPEPPAPVQTQINFNLTPTNSVYVSENLHQSNSGWSELNAQSTTVSFPKPNYEYADNLYGPNDKLVPDKAVYPDAKVYNRADVSNLDCDEKMLYPFAEETDTNLMALWNSKLFNLSNNFWDIFSNGDANLGANSEQKDLNNFHYMPTIDNYESGEGIEKSLQHVKLEDICLNIISDLNEFGICVLDKFLGTEIGTCIETEVKSLFMKGIFKKGQLVNSEILQDNENIRGDLITWVSGNEQSCQQIGNLIKKLDFVITACNKMPNNGVLGKYNLNRRTKAMIACYPGDGTHYKKHVDNPHGDGRCITCIYYINKEYDRKTHGGVLRMFPVQNQNEVANIEPIFDRMIFFWSDRRNPHEVLPTHATRFAITVWYFDADEREKALQKYRTKMQNHS